MAMVDLAIQLIGAFLALYALMGIAQYVRNVLRVKQRNRELFSETSEMFHGRVQKEMAKIDFKNEWESQAWPEFRPFRLVKKELENIASDIYSFYLTPVDGEALAPYLPGQHITVAFKSTKNDQKIPHMRCYSLSGNPNKKEHYRISVKKNPAPEGESFSAYLHEHAEVGDIVQVKAPSGHFHLDTADTRPVVMLAAGIGITPFLSMLRSLCDIKSEREVWLFYGVRNSDELIMKQQLKTIAGCFPNIKIKICFSDPTPKDEHNKSFHFKSWVCTDLLRKVLPSNNYVFYICGPAAMQEDLIDGLDKWGVPEQDVHYESFGGTVVTKKGKNPFKIFFAKSKKEVVWEEGTILDIAEGSEVGTIQRGCGVGVCGSCKCAIKSGTVDYARDPMFADLEENMFLPCIAIPSEDIVLDA